MTTKQAALGIAACAAGTAVYAAAVYGSLPAELPTHWNIYGRVDGWAPRPVGAFLMPGIAVVLLALLYGLPYLSPKRFKVEPFLSSYCYIMVLLAVLMAYLQVVTLEAALHPNMDSGRALVAGIFLFFALLGNMLGKVRRNFWIGIRTPWTLADDGVWIATHRLAGRLMVAVGIAGAIMVLAGVSPAICFVLLMAALLVPVLYSLVLYKRVEPTRPE